MDKMNKAAIVGELKKYGKKLDCDSEWNECWTQRLRRHLFEKITSRS